MRNIPVLLTAYRLMVVEEPALKMREKDGQTEVATDNDGASLFTVTLHVKAKGEKGEEIRVTLMSDPGDGFEYGDQVEMVDPTVSPYSFKNAKGETVSGLAWRAAGLKPLG
ncbi:hypothetical protein ACFV4N_05265 [Actinosynnema sp. NPDC059797]